MAGGVRPGAGRPAGSKDKAPRLKRTDILIARREDWDRWERNSHALEKARKRLLEIIEDPETATRDVLNAIKLIEERGMGKVGEEREPPTSQPLLILMPGRDGGYQQLKEGDFFEGEFVDRPD